MRLNLPLDNVPFLRLTPGELYLEGSPSAFSTKMCTDLVDLWKLRVLGKLLRFEHLTFLKVTITVTQPVPPSWYVSQYIGNSIPLGGLTLTPLTFEGITGNGFQSNPTFNLPFFQHKQKQEEVPFETLNSNRFRFHSLTTQRIQT